MTGLELPRSKRGPQTSTLPAELHPDFGGESNGFMVIVKGINGQ